ncbi:LuxR C-terminal-related transcriptional regulator [Dyella japonica]|uniref:PAS domain S-box-containing protein n=1 Tax=Dyella japonica TaxID=231455 RepID=A0ABV2JYY2_9GAMM
MHQPGFEAALFASIGLSPIATLVTNPRLPDNPIVCANAAFCALTGYGENDILGRNCRFLQGANTEPDQRALLREAIAKGRPTLTVLTNYRKDGTPFRNAVMVAPLFGADGAIEYFIGSQMDVTDAPDRAQHLRITHASTLVASLTPRQKQVLECMARGLRNKQIGEQLGIEEKTVKMHRASLLKRLGATTSADAIRIAIEARAPT